MGITGRIKESASRIADDTVANVRAKHLARWMDVCGVDNAEDIDYTNSFVRIEWLLCDPYWLHKIKSKRGREEFFAELDSAEAKWIYLHYKDEEDGSNYRTLERNTVIHQIDSALKKRLRNRGKAPESIEESENPV